MNLHKVFVSLDLRNSNPYPEKLRFKIFEERIFYGFNRVEKELNDLTLDQVLDWLMSNVFEQQADNILYVIKNKFLKTISYFMETSDEQDVHVWHSIKINDVFENTHINPNVESGFDAIIDRSLDEKFAVLREYGSGKEPTNKFYVNVHRIVGLNRGPRFVWFTATHRSGNALTTHTYDFDMFSRQFRENLDNFDEWLKSQRNQIEAERMAYALNPLARNRSFSLDPQMSALGHMVLAFLNGPRMSSS